MLDLIRRGASKISHFCETQGFPIIVTLCVAIITSCALWTRKQQAPYVSPTPPVGTEISAAQLLQQTLREAATPAPSPTSSPIVFSAPFDNVNILQGFSMAEFIPDATGIWHVHTGVDLAAKRGTPVKAAADGIVINHGNDQLLGTWLRINHGDVDLIYAGMALSNGYITGDQVRAGGTIGFCGDGPAAEAGMESHLHLEALHDGEYIDPCSLW